jgi:hypothetical protein
MRRAQPAGRETLRAEPLGALESQRVRISETTRPSLLDDERANRVVLPADYPQWRKDQLSLSSRARALLSRLRPFMIHVLTFWDHGVASLALDELTLDVDASGSYRAH